ncbi:ADP-ribosylhydrolase ARH3 [Diabrotica virgifera virgifera]|uniref:ADP-ribosylhydrolase ARH3 n=1 Tax=Diabrotica virgifera virgifera TaxID=50390 RepID=A0A6P7FZQ5_DIAVI|nr:ADP-ribosylhydrolase ARH3 [Diabrotica virgifera virgifera]
MSIIKHFTMAKMEAAVLKSKFKGCLLGALVGDCTGSPFEGDTITHGDKLIIQKYFDRMQDPTFSAPYKSYTDDTAMMKSVAKFLTDKPEPDYKFLARLFVNEYFKEPKRGYGQSIVDVFRKLKNTKYEDVFKPAKEQFLGEGSFGNGGAMRIAPVALYFHDNYKAMVEAATNATKLTHTHILGVNGAILQSIAIQLALKCDPEAKIDAERFCAELYRRMRKVERVEEDLDDIEEDESASRRAYQDKIRIVEYLIGKKDDDELDEEVILTLGNGISAYESVPTAIYCFLKALKEIPHIQTDNIFRRTIQHAVTLGGDTDTIACMAGAIAGAYLGEEAINPILAKNCEFSKEIVEVAENLYTAKEGPP